MSSRRGLTAHRPAVHSSARRENEKMFCTPGIVRRRARSDALHLANTAGGNEKTAPHTRDGVVQPGRLAPAQASKDFPQPHELCALGLEILNPPAFRLSEKSITAPRR